MSDDLFTAKPYVGRSHPETSHEAAAKIEPKMPALLRAVLTIGKTRGAYGFTDSELFAYKALGKTENSLRPARVQLTAANYFIRTKEKRDNDRGNACFVYVHRDYYENPPPILPLKQAKGKAAVLAEQVERLEARVAYLELLLTKEGIEYA